MTLSSLLAVACIALPLEAQTPTAGSSATKGSCSPAVSGNNNTFTINCQGITKEQSTHFLALLNKIASNSLDSKVVMEMLDELISNTRQLKSGVEEIRKRQDGRRISPAQEAQLLKVLSAITPKLGVTIYITNETPESTQFAEDIQSSFVKAGWKVAMFPHTQIGLVLPKGQGLLIRSSDSRTAIQIRRLFDSIGIAFDGYIDPNMSADSLGIRVWPSPKSK